MYCKTVFIVSYYTPDAQNGEKIVNFDELLPSSYSLLMSKKYFSRKAYSLLTPTVNLPPCLSKICIFDDIRQNCKMLRKVNLFLLSLFCFNVTFHSCAAQCRTVFIGLFVLDVTLISRSFKSHF